MRPCGSDRSRPPTSAAPPGISSSGSTTSTDSRCALVRRRGPPCSGSTRRPSGPPSSSRARSACCGACSRVASRRWRRSSSRTTRAGPMSPPRPPAPGAGRRPRRRRDRPTVGYRRRDVHPDGGCPRVLLPLVGLLLGVLAGLILNVNVSFEFSRYSAVAILAALDSVLGAVRAELDGVYDNRIFISGFIVNAIIAVLLTFIGDRLGLDLYLVALITFGLRIFDNVALIRRHFL